MVYPALHGPSRPSWTCTTCGEEWPCVPKKRQLAHLFGEDIRKLRRQMLAYALMAVTDLPHVPQEEIRERFIGWPGKPLQELPGGTINRGPRDG